MKALIDADILRYEVGFGAETGWEAIKQREEIPPWEYVENFLNERLARILAATQSDDYCLYLSKGPSFRQEIAKTRPYKGQRIEHKPWHYANLTAYIQGCLKSRTVEILEADDAIGLDHIYCQNNGISSIVCSRDKDFRQLPGLYYSWELGLQPSYGPMEIKDPGTLILSPDRKSIKGTGFAFFCSQLLTGDRVDNIPGAGGYGPVKTYDILSLVLGEDVSYPHVTENLLYAVEQEYKKVYKENWFEMLKEQGNLLWIIREMKDGQPVLFSDVFYNEA